MIFNFFFFFVNVLAFLGREEKEKGERITKQFEFFISISL
jgi:hypothetical protein